MKKNKSVRIIIVIALIIIGVYLAINYKEVKQNFINGINDGKAEKAKESK